jgi:DNA polymerase III subunit delta
MKLTAGQIAGFLQKPDPATRVVLIYGPDAGLVRERAEILARKIVADLADPFRVAVLTGAIIADDPARLMDEMAAQALGGGRRLVRITAATDSIAVALNSLLETMPPGDSMLIIEGGELEKRSKLRALCEGGDRSVTAIACYAEEGAARQRIIGDILRELGARASGDALGLLGDILPLDRLAMRSELEKLALYVEVAGDQGLGVGGWGLEKEKGSLTPNPKPQTPKTVTLEDVLAIVQDAGDAEIDDLVFAVGAGEARRAEILINRLIAEQTSPVAILRAAQRHFLRLQWARADMDRGSSAAEAIKKLQPPVFWKYSDSMSAQLRRWPQPRIEKALGKLFEAEMMVKSTGMPDTTLCGQLLLGMAAA